MVFADSSMDFEEKLLSLLGRDTLHEYPRRTSFVKFITDSNECLGASSDLSCFSPFRWEDLLKDVGELRRPPVSRVERHDVAATGCGRYGGVRVRALERLVDVGSLWSVRAPERPIEVRLRSGRIFSDPDRQLIEVVYKDPVGRWTLSGRQFCEEANDIVVLSRDVMQLDPLELVL